VRIVEEKQEEIYYDLTLVSSNIRKLNRVLSLSYILQTIVCAHTMTNLSKSLYTLYRVNILLLYYTILSVLEPFIIFFVLYNYVIYDCDIYDHLVIGITHDVTPHSLSEFKK